MPALQANYEGKLSEETLQIRLCAIDTPETAKFGKPSQVCVPPHPRASAASLAAARPLPINENKTACLW